jgi:hypothetical protein
MRAASNVMPYLAFEILVRKGPMADKAKHSADDVRRAVERVRAVLDRKGLLICHDPEISSATAIIAGESIRGTWWPHPKGGLIYDALGALDEDVAWPKLVRGKVTLVHRRLWPALFVAGTSRATWQIHKLKDDAKWLLQQVSAKKSLRSDKLDLPPGSRKMGTVVTDLEQRLLVCTRSEHTDEGHHARFVETWATWRDQLKVGNWELPPLDQALDLLTAPVRKLTKQPSLKGWLPWMT